MEEYYNNLRYKHDSIIETAISFILLDNQELSSNKLHRQIQNFVFDYIEGMRKVRRDTDKNEGYKPSQSKISATLHGLLKLGWIKKRASSNDVKNERSGLTEVFYSLTEDLMFASGQNDYFVV